MPQRGQRRALVGRPGLTVSTSGARLTMAVHAPAAPPQLATRNGILAVLERTGACLPLVPAS
jgi:hypothetical protein